MKEKVLKAVNTVHNASRFVKLIFLVFLCLIAMVISLAVSGARFAYKVNYAGKIIGVVDSKSDFDIIKAGALERVEAENKGNLIYKPDFSLTLTLPAGITKADVLENSVLSNTAELSLNASLCVDGKNVILYENKDELVKLADKRLNQYNVANYENKCEFVKNVEIKDIYCKKSDCSDSSKASGVLSGIGVKTTVKYTTDVITNFSTVTEKTDKKLIGYCAVTVNGKTGLNHTVEQVEMLNGVETSRVQLAQEVVRKPVNKVITIGTGTASKDGKGASGMMYPLPKNVKMFISTHFGERDSGSHIHKGVDYVVAKGTPIYAAKGGIVTRSCYRSDYGNCIIINHGDGVQTLYAHCKELYVRVGQEVKKGQTIATVGTTGQSTGYHLHFEVMINGGYVNPTKYVSK